VSLDKSKLLGIVLVVQAVLSFYSAYDGIGSKNISLIFSFVLLIGGVTVLLKKDK